MLFLTFWSPSFLSIYRLDTSLYSYSNFIMTYIRLSATSTYDSNKKITGFHGIRACLENAFCKMGRADCRNGFSEMKLSQQKYNKINKTGAVENYQIFHCA